MKYKTLVYLMLTSYFDKDYDKTVWALKGGESYQPYKRSIQVRCELLYQTDDAVNLDWEKMLHTMLAIEIGQNRGPYGTEYFGFFEREKDARKFAADFWPDFQEIVKNSPIEDPDKGHYYTNVRFAADRLCCNTGIGEGWGKAIRAYHASFNADRALRNKYPRRLRPFYQRRRNWREVLAAA